MELPQDIVTAIVRQNPTGFENVQQLIISLTSDQLVVEVADLVVVACVTPGTKTSASVPLTLL